MSYEIEYTDKWSGKKVVSRKSGSEGNARRDTEYQARHNNCKAVCTHVADTPFGYRASDSDGHRTHVVSEGDN